jgi:hypothetical protein
VSSWQEQSACKTADPALFASQGFFEKQTDLSDRVMYATAHYCDRCPVQRACRQWAENNHAEGVWGGELFLPTPRPRDRKGQPCGTEAGYRRHVLNEKSIPCVDCVAAHEEANLVGKGLKPCGTLAAYRRHNRHHEEPCGPCKRAHADSVRERIARNGRKPRKYAEEKARRFERQRLAASSAA